MHVLGNFVQSTREGERVFPNCTAPQALETLRFVLVQLGVKDAAQYRTHDLRRGHARDLQVSGAPLWEILAAGEWRSPAFLKYLDLHQLETDLVVQAHVEDSDGEAD